MNKRNNIFVLIFIIAILIGCEKKTQNFTYLETKLGGCNYKELKSSIVEDDFENDTVVFSEQNYALNIFVGINLSCCIEFKPSSEFNGDTLVMEIKTLNNDFCDCVCYYTFDFVYSDYEQQGFHYQFYVDEYMKLEGKYNLQ